MRRLAAFIPIAFLAVMAWAADETAPATSQRKPIEVAKLSRKSAVDFESEVLPVLQANCLACHNRTSAKGGLNLETPEDMLKGGDSGPAIVRRKGGSSLLVKVAAHQDPDMIMPPVGNKSQALDLTPEQLGLIKLWIDQGARGSVATARTVNWQPLPDDVNAILAVSMTADAQFAACSRGNQVFIYHLPASNLVARLADPSLIKSGLYAQPGAAHRDVVNALAFSPDGLLLATAGYREIKLWRRHQDVPREVMDFKMKSGLVALAASADGQWVAAGGADGSVRLWDMARNRSGRSFSAGKAAVKRLKFSPDNQELLIAYAGGALRLFGAKNGRRIGEITGAGEVGDFVWLSDAARLALAGVDGRISLWQRSTSGSTAWTTTGGFMAHEGGVTALATVSTNTQQLVTGGADGIVRLWDLEKASVLREFKHGASLSSVAVSEDGRRLATAGGGVVARIWDLADGRQLAEVKGDREAVERAGASERFLNFAVNEVAYHKGNVQNVEKQQQAAAERVKKAVEAQAAAVKPLEEKQTARNAAAESNDKADRELADANAAPNAATEEGKNKIKQAMDRQAATAKALADAETALKKAGTTKSVADNEVTLANLALKREDENLTAARSALERAEAVQKEADAVLKKARESVSGTERPLHYAGFSSDDRSLWTLGEDRALRQWHGGTGAAMSILRGKATALMPFTIMPDNMCLLAGDDHRARLFSLTCEWSLERVIGGGPDAPFADRVNALAFSPDGKLLASGGGEPSRGGEVHLWEIVSGRSAGVFKGIHSDAVLSVQFSPDGSLLASGGADRFARVTDVLTGRVVKAFEGHTHHVQGVSWKSDGRTLATAGADNVVKTWNVLTGERLKNIGGFDKEVTAVCHNGFTDQFVAVAGDGRVRLLKEDGGEVRSFAGGRDFMTSVAIDPGGRLVIAGGHDSVLRVWKISGETIAVFTAPEASSVELTRESGASSRVR